jgi:hypothetical protein
MDLKKQLHTVFLRSPANLFDEFIQECQRWYSQPAHTLQQMRQRDSKKVRGDIFEDFCVLYLKEIRGFQEVWLLEDLPEEYLEQLSLKRRDMGIDIIVKHNDEWYAVQCKYKTPSPERKKSYITWSALSTFYAMCLRTGPWAKYIVMTNCDYTRHQGPKGPKDLSICLGTFQAMKSEDWLKLCDIEGKVLTNEIKATPTTIEDLRARRLAYYTTKELPWST